MRTFAISARHAAASLLLAAAAAPGLVAGCSSASRICSDACTCESCSPDQFDACVKRIDDSEKVAVDVKCEAEADAFEGCAADRGSCTFGIWVIGGCEVERIALTKCLAKSNCSLDVLGAIRCS